jgi:hypothetical protein
MPRRKGIDKSLSFYVPPEIYRRIKFACVENDKKLQDWLLESVLRVLDNPQEKESICDWVSGWDLTKLENRSGISVERLKQIASGSYPDCSEAAGLLKAGVNPELLKQNGLKENSHHA